MFECVLINNLMSSFETTVPYRLTAVNARHSAFKLRLQCVVCSSGGLLPFCSVIYFIVMELATELVDVKGEADTRVRRLEATVGELATAVRELTRQVSAGRPQPEASGRQ